MSSPIYKPVSQNGRADVEKTNGINPGSKDPQPKEVDDTRCGFWTVKPDIMQPCANIGCFTGFYSVAALITSTLSVYVNSQITTLERQFGFSSKQTGVIMAANDIGYLICVLFVSYSASMLHIPKSLGVATMIFGLSGVACSLPHFLFGGQMNFDPTIDSSNATSSMAASSQKSAMFGDLCDSGNHTVSSCQAMAGQKSSSPTSVPESVAVASLVIIVIGMMLQGFGKAPRYSFTVTYVDNNTAKVKTGFFMGIITTVGILGPAVAFLFGGVFTKLYVTLEDTNLTPRHPKWIGAWWLGYIVFGVLGLLVGVPLFCFPRQLPRKESKKGKNKIVKGDGALNKKDSQIQHSIEPHTGKGPLQNNHLGATKAKRKFSIKSVMKLVKDFFATLFRLWTNPVYLSMVASSCFIIFSVGGSSAYSPKYLEGMFDLPAYKANYIMAAKTLCAGCVGTFIGGYLTMRLKMTAYKALKFMIVVVTLSNIANIMGFVFQCEQPVVHNWPGSEETCDRNCNCEENSYFAICGADGKTYYSPCHAGCLGLEKGVYHNCTCIPGGTATSGTCDYGCDHIYPYAIFSALGALCGTLSIIPKMIVFIRCVADKDKSLAVGFSSFMTSLLGWLLGPIVFGSVIDGICTVWDVDCGVTGRCLLYNNDLFRLKFHGYSTAARIGSLLCVVIAYIYARCTKCLDDPDGVNKELKKRSPEMNLMVNGEGAGDGLAGEDAGAEYIVGHGKNEKSRDGNDIV